MTDTSGILDIRDAVANRSLDPQAEVTRAWERAQAREPDLHAFAFLPETAPKAGTGPLAGVTVGVKDLIDTADMPTAYGTSVLVGHRPAADAAVVARLRALGAAVLGKTITTEFAYRHPGPTRNPWNLAHSPGGSSSGSAASVAAGIVPLALGTQTMGSVIRPAAFNGIVGYKPTFGTLSREGVHPLCNALDYVGLFARSVEDIAFILGLLADDPALAAAVPLATDGKLRLAALPLTDETIQPAQKAAAEAAQAVLRAAGHTVEPLDLPAAFGAVHDVTEVLLAHESIRHFGALVERYGEGLSPPILALVEKGRSVGEGAYREAIATQEELRRTYAGLTKDFDAVLTIPAAGEAPEGLDWTGDPRFCVPGSVLGVPALTFPVGKGPAGLPLGVQLMGRWGEDAALLKAGAAAAALFPRVTVAA